MMFLRIVKSFIGYFLIHFKNVTLILILSVGFFSSQVGSSQPIAINQKSDGWSLAIDGIPVLIKGVNWDYFPIGTNYEYNLWNQSDQLIKQVLADEMKMLSVMGANAVRIYTPMPKKWITYIHEKYGIYTVLNHSFGRYGLTIDGTWQAKTDYANEKVKSLLLDEIKQLSIEYLDTPGLLMLLLGNENNYGLFWEGAETEDVPDDSNSSVASQARSMYRLFNDAAKVIKANNPRIPIALCNGDIQYIDIIAEECNAIDIFGMNIYRGSSFGNVFIEVSQRLNKPVLLTEFGSDAFNAITQIEAQEEQANLLAQNWKEIYQNVAGMGSANNVIGGLTFQFSDGWWKYGQTNNLNIHDTYASWSNGGYSFDYEEGLQNMNEEWFGICAKGDIKPDGSYTLKPRKAFYLIQKIHEVDPYQTGIDLDFINRFFESLAP